MALVEFDFANSSWKWNMKSACSPSSSVNPAPVTTPCIYIIHNENTNNTYVGYAGDAKHRWKTRAEAFHCLGIDPTYAGKVHCAACKPTWDSSGSQASMPNNLLEGVQKAEHLLMRAVVNGLLGVTTCTNTRDAKTPFGGSILGQNVSDVRVYLPTFGSKLHKAKTVKVGNSY